MTRPNANAYAAAVTPHNRILVVVGGAAVIACLTILGIFAQTDLAGASLRTDVEAALRIQRLGDDLVGEVQAQRTAIDEYLLTANARPLDRYWRAVADQTETSAQILASAWNLPGIADALAHVNAMDRAWRTSVAAPALAAVDSGSIGAVKTASSAVINDGGATEAATNEFRLRIATLGADLRARADRLNGLRGVATGLGILIELIAAGLSLWFVRRYGLRVARETGWRVRTSAERVAIVASLRTLRTQATPESTAEVIAEALNRLPGVDVAGVFECTDDAVIALSIVGLPGFPIQTGDALPEAQAREIRERSTNGPWAARWIWPAERSPYAERLAMLGVKCWAIAPIQADGELIGLIGLATTSEDHARHVIEDLPAVGEFASVAETILAPDLVVRRHLAERRRRISATIASAAFQPVFQPIVVLSTGMTVGFEALTRFHDGSRPDEMFSAALECGMGLELETMTLEAALREADRLPPGAWLSLNISPAMLAEELALQRLFAGTTRSVVLEITEHEAIEDYAPLREALARFTPSVRLAVDDAGAGVANFNHLVGLRPDYVKIDAGLVRGVNGDPSRQAVVVGLIHFAMKAGCEVIAEGIETEAEGQMVAELGVTLGQGYLLAKPARAEKWSEGVERPRSKVTILPAHRGLGGGPSSVQGRRGSPPATLKVI
jgi:EAL domain-containing protein (putative c-di-GMP-specific phosphodiesterase class I)